MLKIETSGSIIAFQWVSWQKKSRFPDGKISNDELVLPGYLDMYMSGKRSTKPFLLPSLHLILPLILPLLDLPKHFIYTSSIFYYNPDFYGFISQIKYIKSQYKQWWFIISKHIWWLIYNFSYFMIKTSHII